MQRGLRLQSTCLVAAVVAERLMSKRALLRILVAVAVLCVAALMFLGPQIQNARRSCRTFQGFCDHIRAGDWVSARAMTLTEPDWFRVEDGAVYYWNHDTTAAFIHAKPLFGPTLEYYLTDRHMGDKVIFQAHSRGDYAQLEEGKIKFIKMT